MKRIKDICLFSKYSKIAGEIVQLGPSCCHNYHSGIPQAKAIAELRSLLPLRGSLCENLLQQAALGTGARVLSERLILVRKLSWRFDLPFSCKDSPLRSKESALVLSCKYGQSVKTDTCLSRDFLVQLWIKDRKVKSHKSKKRVDQHSQSIGPISRNQPLRFPFGRWFTAVPVAEEKYDDQVKPVFNQPPPSQSATGFLKPSSPEEAKVAPLLARSNLLITRDIEWANLVFGFEQENRYAIVDACYPHSPVGFMREQSNFLARQLLRLRRPFVAYITDAMGNELFRIRRPFWWITSTIYAEIDGKEIGVVHRRWHLWRRVYDLYLGKKQFAVVENPGFWNWTFTLKDADGKVLAEINRDWRGFGFELLTDAGQYVIRFGCSDPRSKIGPARAIQDLEITRPLTLSERAVTLALAVSLDNDYFSRHGGWGLPVIAVTE